MYTGDIIQLSGCFTKQLVLQGRTLVEIETILGYHRGRLSEGAWFAVATRLPQPDDFEFAGYTQVATHHTREQYGNINNPQGNWEKEAYDKTKREVLNTLKLFGSQRLIKVLPVIRHSREMDIDTQYRPGSGVPQWVLTKPVTCKIISFVTHYPEGRFVPDEGFTPVHYQI